MKTPTSAQFQMALNRLLDWYNDADKQDRAQFIEKFDRMLDDLSSMDMFGTEGQLDPRGDQRDSLTEKWL